MSQDNLPIQVAVLSDAGLARETNEDSVKIYDADHLVRAGGRLFIVADGVGGDQHGQLASQVAVDQVGEMYYAYMQEYPDARPAHALKLAIEQANRVIFDRALSLGVPEQMGTTIAAVVLRPDRLSIAWVGDSRVYLVQGDTGTIQQLTYDHKVVAEQVRQGVLTEEEAIFHPNRTMLSRCLGHQPQVEVDVLAGEVLPDDVLVLCSDGLTRYITEAELAAQVRSGENLNVVARRLVSLANDRGGMDNISIIIVRLEATADSRQPVSGPAVEGDSALPAPSRTRRQAPPPEVPLAPEVAPAPPPPAEKPVRTRRSRARESRSRVGIVPIAVIGLLALVIGGFLLVRGLFVSPDAEGPAAAVLALTTEAPVEVTQTPTVQPTIPSTPTDPPPTVTPTPTDTPPPSPTPTPIDPNAPRDWAVGATLYVTEDTGVFASAGGAASSRQLTAGQAVIVVRSGSGASGDYRYQRDGRWWWHVGVEQNDTIRFPGWVPQDVLSDSPPE